MLAVHAQPVPGDEHDHRVGVVPHLLGVPQRRFDLPPGRTLGQLGMRRPETGAHPSPSRTTRSRNAATSAPTPGSGGNAPAS